MLRSKDRDTGKSILGQRMERPALIQSVYTGIITPNVITQTNNLLTKQGLRRRQNSWRFREIESMSLPLTTINRNLIDGMYRKWILADNPLVQDTMTVLATVYVMEFQKKKKIIPEKLQPMAERLIDYFSNYVDKLVDVSPKFFDKSSFQVDLATMGPQFVEALAIFTPAYLGITPSSIVKLFTPHFQNPNILKKIFQHWLGSSKKRRQKALEAVRTTVQYSHKQDSLVPELEEYQYFNPEADSRSSQMLLQYYGEQHITFSQQLEAYDQSQQLLQQYDTVRNIISHKLYNSSLGYQPVKLTEGHVVKNIDITSQYTNTQIFILHFDDSTYLTLEIGEYKNSKGEKDLLLFGIPPQLNQENPNLQYLILKDILLAVNSYAQTLPHPPGVTKVAPLPPITLESGTEQISKEIIYLSRGKRRITGKSTQQPQIVVESPHFPETRQKRIVIHSRGKIVGDLGGKRAQKKEIDKLLYGIRAFERGQNENFKPLKSCEGYGELRIGKFRVIIRDCGNNRYIYEEVLHRKDLDKKY